MSKVKILNAELDIDFFDSNLVDRLEFGVEKVQKESNYYNQNEKLSDAIKRQCNIVRDFFDDVFGIGTANKVFENRYSLTDAIEAFEVILEEKEKQSKKLSVLNEKYSTDRLKR